MKKSQNWKKLLCSLEHINIHSAKHYSCRAPLFGKPHYHNDLYHIVYVISGKGKIAIESLNYNAKSNNVIFVKPKQMHSSINDQNTDYELIEIKFSAKFNNYDKIIPDIPTVIDVHNTTAINSAMERIVISHIFKDNNNIWLNKVQLAELLILLTKEFHRENFSYNISTDMDRKIQQALEYIAIHYSKPITVDYLAELTGLSTSHFAFNFKQRTNVTPIEFVIQTRFTHAKELLENSTLSIAQIASACGFYSSQYFARIFKKRFDCSPIDFRRKRQKHLKIVYK